MHVYMCAHTQPESVADDGHETHQGWRRQRHLGSLEEARCACVYTRTYRGQEEPPGKPSQKHIHFQGAHGALTPMTYLTLSTILQGKYYHPRCTEEDNIQRKKLTQSHRASGSGFKLSPRTPAPPSPSSLALPGVTAQLRSHILQSCP